MFVVCCVVMICSVCVGVLRVGVVLFQLFARCWCGMVVKWCVVVLWFVCCCVLCWCVCVCEVAFCVGVLLALLCCSVLY